MRPNIRVFHSVLRASVAVATVAALGACVSIPKRAWANGEAMTSSRAYQRVLSGDNSIRAHRELQSTLNPRRLNYREVAFPVFGDWW